MGEFDRPPGIVRWNPRGLTFLMRFGNPSNGELIRATEICERPTSTKSLYGFVQRSRRAQKSLPLQEPSSSIASMSRPPDHWILFI